MAEETSCKRQDFLESVIMQSFGSIQVETVRFCIMPVKQEPVVISTFLKPHLTLCPPLEGLLL